MADADSSIERGGRRRARQLKIRSRSRSLSSPVTSLNRPSNNNNNNREGIIDKVDGVRMHVSLSEAVRSFVWQKKRRELRKGSERKTLQH
jgi:hypothetical protein